MWSSESSSNRTESFLKIAAHWSGAPCSCWQLEQLWAGERRGEGAGSVSRAGRLGPGRRGRDALAVLAAERLGLGEAVLDGAAEAAGAVAAGLLGVLVGRAAVGEGVRRGRPPVVRVVLRAGGRHRWAREVLRWWSCELRGREGGGRSGSCGGARRGRSAAKRRGGAVEVGAEGEVVAVVDEELLGGSDRGRARARAMVDEVVPMARGASSRRSPRSGSGGGWRWLGSTKAALSRCLTSSAERSGERSVRRRQSEEGRAASRRRGWVSKTGLAAAEGGGLDASTLGWARDFFSLARSSPPRAVTAAGCCPGRAPPSLLSLPPIQPTPPPFQPQQLSTPLPPLPNTLPLVSPSPPPTMARFFTIAAATGLLAAAVASAQATINTPTGLIGASAPAPPSPPSRSGLARAAAMRRIVWPPRPGCLASSASSCGARWGSLDRHERESGADASLRVSFLAPL